MPDGSRLTHLRQRRSTYVDPTHGEMSSEAIRARALSVAPRNPLLRIPLIRTIYVALFLLTTLLLLVPLWALYYVPPHNRPRRSWTVKRCLRVRWSRRLCGLVARCEIDYLGRDLSKPLDPVKLMHSHPVTIPPAPPEWLRGHPAEMLEQLWSLRGKWTPHLVTRPTRAGPWGRWNPSLHEHGELNKGHPYGFIPVPAFWYEGSKLDFGARRKERAPGAPTVLLFHGGGYIAGTAAEHDLCSGIAKRLVAHTPIDHVLSVDYRLAPAAPWPLPLLDAISAYAYLVSQGVDERDLLVGGDSAGGHLAIALTRWLRDEGAALGLRGPRGLLAFSPWCDLGFTHMWDPAGLAHNAECDTIDDTFGLFASSLLLRALPGHVMHQSAYISPASLLIPPTATGPASFDKFPPVFITMGGAERLGLEIAELYARVRLARGEKDVDIRDELVVSEDAVHDFLIFPWFAAEAAAAYEQLDEWLRTLLSEEDSDDELDELAELVLPSPVLLPDTPPELPAVQTQPNITPLTPISPLTPGTPLSPLSFSSWLRAARRASRSPSDRFVLRSTKSPRMRPTAPDSPAQLLEDMRHEGMHLLHLDVPALDLGASVGTFVEQYQGEEEGVWHELDGEQVSEDEGEDMD